MRPVTNYRDGVRRQSMADSVDRPLKLGHQHVAAALARALKTGKVADMKCAMNLAATWLGNHYEEV